MFSRIDVSLENILESYIIKVAQPYRAVALIDS